MDSLREIPITIIKSLAQVRKTPYIGMVLLGLVFVLAFFTIKTCSTDPHLKNARKSYESGDFSKAVSEAELYLEKDPLSTPGLILLGDAHSALVDLTRSNAPQFNEHACAAIRAYKKSMGKGYNNNIATKIAMIEQRLQDLYDSQGRYYGRCPDSEVTNP